VVTASGELVTASAEEHSDLFFGLRGGGGNFGIATTFEYRLYRHRGVVGGMVWHPLERITEVLAFFRDWAPDLPDEVGTTLFVLTAPDTPQIPAELRGRTAVTIAVCHSSPGDSAGRVLSPVRAFGPPAADLICAQPYPELQAMLDASNPPQHQCYWKAEYLGELTDEAIAAIAEHSARKPAGLSKVLLTRLGGAASRIPEDATAFSHRGAPYVININGMGPDPAELDGLAIWAREMWDAVQPFSFGGTYVNFLGDEGQDRVRAAYGDEKFARLVKLKRKYDPTNFFRLNQNIAPTRSPPYASSTR
jgi:FAD/FMN-containing dehydrogenase